MHNKLESVEVKLKMTQDERRSLEEDFAAYRELVPPLTEEVRQGIIREYQSSSELENEVVEQFDLSYQDARTKDKATMQARNLDSTILDSSDDKAEV